MSYVIVALIHCYFPTAPCSRRHNECQIWPGELQQFTEAHFHLHPVVHGGDVAPHQVCGGAEGPGDQPEHLQLAHTVHDLRGRSLPLLPHLWIPAGNTQRKTVLLRLCLWICRYMQMWSLQSLFTWAVLI